MIKVLVTCIGSGVGQSAIDSLNLAGNYHILGIDMNLDVYANHHCNQVVKSPSIYDLHYIDFLITLCIENSIDIIIPGHDHELGLLSAHRERFSEQSIKVLVSDSDLVNISRDKYKWYEFFKERGCNVVTTYTLDDYIQSPNESIFPAIIKPVGGSASQNISIVHNLGDVKVVAQDYGVDNYIIQPYLLPPSSDENYDALKKAVSDNRLIQLSEISIQLIFNKNGEFISSFISCNKLKNGVPVVIDTISVEDFEYKEHLTKFISALEAENVVGPVNLQGRITDNGLVFFEMNMRFTGITGNRAQLGFNEVDYLVKDFMGGYQPPLKYSHNQIGVRQVACTTIRKDNKHCKTVYTILGGGFIGGQLINQLLEQQQQYSINLICRNTSIDKYKLQYKNLPVTVISEDDPNLQNIYCLSDIIINCIGALAYNEDRIIYDAIQSQYKHIDKLNDANVPLIINLSSQSVYDQTVNERKTEDYPLAINNAYSFQKKLGENMFDSIARKYPASRVVSLRLPRVTGQGKSGVNGFFKKIITSLRDQQTIEVPSPKNNTTLINVYDVVDAIHFVIHNDSIGSSILNVSGVDVSMQDYCKAVQIYLGLKDDNLINYSSSEEVTQSSQISGETLEELGWQPKVKLNGLIKEIDLSS